MVLISRRFLAHALAAAGQSARRACRIDTIDPPRFPRFRTEKPTRSACARPIIIAASCANQAGTVALGKGGAVSDGPFSPIIVFAKCFVIREIDET